MKKEQIFVNGASITVLEDDFISLTDIARRFDPEDPAGYIANWLRIKETVEFMGAWETLHNPEFKVVEFDNLLARSGTGRFRLSVKQWLEETAAIGIRAKMGRGGATYAHRDVAVAFCYWVSPGFQVYLVKEFQRLKERENPEWDLRRALAKVNYNLHTNAIRANILPALGGTENAVSETAFSEEANMLNAAVFGMTAAQWRAENPEFADLGLNIRDTADIYQLLVLANLEAYNEAMLSHGVARFEREAELRRTAERQLAALYSMNRLPIKAMRSPKLLKNEGEI